MSTAKVLATSHKGNLEIECIHRKADGTVKSIERTVRPVTYMQHGDQITDIKEY